MPVNKPRRRGSYAPLSAHYYKDDKLIRAGEKAEMLYVRGLAFCADVLSDGFITDAQLTHVGVGLTGVKARAKALVDTGAWERGAGGYFVVAWLHWNKSRDDILDENRKDAGRKGSQSSDQPLPPDPPPGDDRASDPWESDYADYSGEIPFGNHSESSGSPNGVRTGSHAYGPALAPSSSRTEPEPTPEPPLATQGGCGGTVDDEAATAEAKTASRKRSARENGSRIPEDFWPSESDQQWFRENCPNLAGEGTGLTEEFKGYWETRAGKDARKLDWAKTWKTRMRELNRRAGQSASGRRNGKVQTSEIFASGRDLVSRYEAEEAEASGFAAVHQLHRGVS